MELGFTSIILLISAVNGLIFSFIAITRMKEDRNNQYIAVLLLFCSFLIFDEFTRWTSDFIINYPQFTYLFTTAWFLVIPAIYILVRNQINYTGLRWFDIFHTLPLIIQMINSRGFFSSPEEKKGILLHYFNTYEPHDAKVIFGIQILFYLVLIYILLQRKYGFNLPELFKRLSLWLKSVYLLLIAYFISIVLIISCLEWYGIYLRWLDISKTYIFVFVIYGWLLYFLYDPNALKIPIRSSRVWMDQFNLNNTSLKLRELIKKLQDSGIYRNPDTKLSDLAIEGGISARSLTDLVNKELGINVPQLINLMRIKEIEQLIMERKMQNYSLLGLATEVGFKSKASFYRSVKEFTGTTPSHHFKHILKVK
jgi:AraC-like DNA-binding protein